MMIFFVSSVCRCVKNYARQLTFGQSKLKIFKIFIAPPLRREHLYVIVELEKPRNP